MRRRCRHSRQLMKRVRPDTDRNGFSKTTPTFFLLPLCIKLDTILLQYFQNSTTNKQTKKKTTSSIFILYSFRNRVHNTLFHYLTIIPIIPIRSSYRELTFPCETLASFSCKIKGTNIYIYSLTIYIHIYVYIYCMRVYVYSQIGVIHSKRHASSRI